MSTNRRCLVVVAHPDDEALGCGATLHRLHGEGWDLRMALACSQVDRRALRPSDAELDEDMRACCARLGLKPEFMASFPNLELPRTPSHELVAFVEDAYLKFEPELVLIHADTDMNVDHRALADASIVATKVFQRRGMPSPIRRVLAMEIASSTDWAIRPRVDSFAPTTFVPVSQADLDAKIEALAFYRKVMRPHPHPRSRETLEARAVIRGSQCGSVYAEAFELIWECGGF